MLVIYRNIIVFLLMNALVAISAYNLLKIFNLTLLVDNILAFALLFCSQIILTEISLGLFGQLTLNNLIILNSALFLLAISFLRNKKFSPHLQPDFSFGLFKNKLIYFALSCILGFGLVKVLVNLINPPFGWDNLNYHFTFPVEWLKQTNLTNPMVINCDPSPPYYPINGSLLFFWLMLPFRDVFLADLGQLPFFLLCFLAVFSISRRIVINEDYSFLSAALFVLIPNFFKQLEIAYVDVILAAFFLIALNFLFLLNERFNLKNLLLFSIGFGLFIGTKTVAIPFGIILFILFILIISAKKDIKKAGLFLIICALAVFLLGSFSYVRNFLLTNNFLYPANLKIFGRTVMKGVLDISYYKAHYVARDFSLAKLLFHEGFGVQTIILVLPAIFLSIPLTFLKNRQKLNFIFGYFLTIPLLLYLAYRYIIPLAASRYLYPTLALGLVIAFYCLEILRINKKIVYTLALICIIASLSELTRKIQIFYSLLVTVIIFSLSFVNFKKMNFIKKFKMPLCAIFILIFILGLGFIQRDYLQHEFQRYIKPIMARPVFWPDASKAWVWLNEHTTGDRIAYVGRPVPFPLYGTHFKNAVYYVPVNKGGCQLHAYPLGHYQRKKDYATLHKNLEELGNYREGANYSVWLNNLLDSNTDYLFIYSLHQTKDIEFPIDDVWAKTHPDNFKPEFTNRTIHIYRIVK